MASQCLQELESLKLRTLIVLPLAVQGEVQGVLEVLTIKDPEFVAGELEILGLVANELAGSMNRKRLMDELRTKNIELESQTQKTLEASDTLKKFLATFSHELRSPLNSIIGFTGILRAGMPGPIDDRYVFGYGLGAPALSRSKWESAG